MCMCMCTSTSTCTSTSQFFQSELIKAIFALPPQENPDAEVSGVLLAEDGHPKDVASLRAHRALNLRDISANGEEAGSGGVSLASLMV